MAIKLVASDLDGTIISENNFINQSNYDVMEKMNNSNVNFAICTGKSYSVCKDLCDKFNADFGIFSNGSQIVDLRTGESIYKNLIDIDVIEDCYRIAKEHGLHVHVYGDNLLVTERLQFLDLRNFKLQKHAGFEFIVTADVLKYIKDNDVAVYQFVISSDGALESVKNEILDENHVSILKISKTGKYMDVILNKEYEYLSVVPYNTNKSTALDILQNYLNITKDEVMAIGDNLNDLDMIKNSGVGVAVANAYSELKDVAKYTTVKSASDGGFAEAVCKFVEFD